MLIPRDELEESIRFIEISESSQEKTEIVYTEFNNLGKQYNKTDY